MADVKNEAVPKEAKVGLGLAGAGGLGWALLQGGLKWQDLVKALPFVIVAAGGALIAFALLKKLRSRLAGQKVRQAMAQNARQVPLGAGAKGEALLDDLRRKFEEGLDRFQKLGKSLYDLPWYMVVGERASGKTELIRRGTQDFRPGFQDPLLGIGGTVNMNWWFTNHGVLLDTAGALMLPEVQTGKNESWEKFLTLLQTQRKQCPINGLVLVIPADTLLTDPEEQVNTKASQIAQRFEEIQGRFGIRFPVFVVITKCDKINGFREFFEKTRDQTQMLGWSNPAGLEQPFSPDAVIEHLQKVHDQLVRRRAQLLQDPVPMTDATRRIDEVDALYEFPDELLEIGPGLRRYLEPIFVAGAWSTKPLFLRGIYFTSSLQTGQALDLAISKMLGQDVRHLLGGPILGQKHMFLRDVFLEKVFREKGLVTRSSNVDDLRRKRKLTLIGTGMAAVLALIGVTFWQTSSLNGKVQAYEPYWKRIRETDASAVPLLVKADGWAKGQEWQWLMETHRNAQASIDRNLDPPVIFRAAAVADSGDFRKNAREAYRRLYEATVLMPLVKQAAVRLGQTWTDQNRVEATDALEQLIYLTREQAEGAGVAKAPIGPLVRFLEKSLGKTVPPADLKLLEKCYVLAYDNRPWEAVRAWPAATEVDGAVAAYCDWWRSEVARKEKIGAGPAEESLKGALAAYRKAEDAFAQVPQAIPTTFRDAETFRVWWAERWAALESAKAQLDRALESEALSGWRDKGNSDPVVYLRNLRTDPFLERSASSQKLKTFFLPSADQPQSQLFNAFNRLKTASADFEDAVARLATPTTAPADAGALSSQDKLVSKDGSPHPYQLRFERLKPEAALLASTYEMAPGRKLSVWEQDVRTSTAPPTNAESDLTGKWATFLHELAVRRGRYAILQGVLPKRLAEPTGWAEAVKKAAATMPPRDETSLPVVMAGSAYKAEYDVDAVQKVLRDKEWAGLTKYFAAGATAAPVEVLDFADLKERYESCRDQYNTYLGALRSHWIGAPRALLEKTEWADCHHALTQLSDQASEVSEYLGRVDAMMPEGFRRPADRAEDEADDAALKPEEKIKHWAHLDATPGNARRTLLLRPLKMFKDEYVHTAPADAPTAEKYWADVSYQAMKSIAAAAVKDADNAYAALTTTYNKFPFDDELGGAAGMTVPDLPSLRDCLNKVSAPDYCPPGTVGKASLDAERQIPVRWSTEVHKLRLDGTNDTPAKQARYDRVQHVSRLLTLLEGKEGALQATITAVRGDDRRAWVEAAWWRLVFGGREVGKAARVKVEPQVIGPNLDVRSGPLTLVMIKDDRPNADARAAPKLPLSDSTAWACLRLVRGSEPVDESRTVYKVKKAFAETKGVRGVYVEDPRGEVVVEMTVEFKLGGRKPPMPLPDLSKPAPASGR